MLIGQQIGLQYLIPRALTLLKDDPLTEGDFYPGDLLCAVLKADSKYWLEHREERRDLQSIASAVQLPAGSRGKIVAKAIAEARAAFEQVGHGSNTSLERTRDR